jgi:serine protease Do
MKRHLVLSLFSIFFTIQGASAQFERGYADLVDELLPSVVSIATSQTVERQTRQLPELPEGHPFNDMFDDFFGNQMPKRENLTGLGSGFIISDEGYVVTNNHVISGADQITVIFNNGIDEVPAELVGTDPKTDIAVLKIDPSTVDIQSVNWGDSDLSRVGDIVLAIGNPLGLGGTVTSGIISSINRDIGGGPYVDFIQTDAPINRGNSGGPLFNLDGEVVGINSQIYSRSGGYQGVSFSIPIDVAIEVADQIISSGEVARGYLGVRMGDVDSDLAQALGMKKPYGALINSIEKDGAADNGGLKTGDVITEFAGEEVKFAGDLPHIVGRKLPGTKSTAKVVRNGKTIKLDFILGKLESSNSTFVPASSTENEYPLGIKVEDLPDDYEAVDEGVMVSKVDNSSNSATKILEGDVITDIQSGFQRYSVKDSDSFNDIVSKFQSGDKIAIFGLRENSRFIVPITVD